MQMILGLIIAHGNNFKFINVIAVELRWRKKEKRFLYIHNHHGAEPFKDLRNAMHQNLKKKKKMFMKKYCCDDVVKMAGVLR